VEALVQNAQERHFQKWPILGMSGQAPEVNAIATTYPAELDTLKAWIATRLIWLDANIPGTCWPPIVDGISEAMNDAALKCYPNPSNGTVQLSGAALGHGPTLIEVYDAAGRIINTQRTTHAGTIILNLPNPGVFNLRVTDAQGTSYLRKVVVIAD
jgi:hypothetical protein